MCRYGSHLREVFNHVSVAIFPDQPHACLAGKLRVEAFLDALNALTINIREANQVSRHMSGRIKTAGLIAEIDTGKTQLIDPLCLGGINLTGKVNESPVRVAVDS